MCEIEPKQDHTCKYSKRREWDDWYIDGYLWRRFARDIPRCDQCGSVQPARRPRTPTREQVKAGKHTGVLAFSPERKKTAEQLVRCFGRDTDKPIGFVGLSRKISSQGIQTGLLERTLEDFVEAGWLCLEWKLDRTKRELFAVHVIDSAGLEDYAQPGLRQSKAEALTKAREVLERLDHPTADFIRDILEGKEIEQVDPTLINALAAVAVHVSSGDVLMERVFSARYLDDSKALAAVRRRLERLIGPLSQFGIREGGAVTLVGGEGCIHVKDNRIDLSDLRPFVGLPREVLLNSPTTVFPAAGLLVVENLTAFEACCRGEVPGAGDALLVWSGGYPGRGVHALVEAAAQGGATIRVWADIDLDGVRIARLVCNWGGSNAKPWRMDPEDLRNSPTNIALTARARDAIKKDLQVHAKGLLTETLRELLSLGRWVEQEMLLVAAYSNPNR